MYLFPGWSWLCWDPGLPAAGRSGWAASGSRDCRSSSRVEIQGCCWCWSGSGCWLAGDEISFMSAFDFSPLLSGLQITFYIHMVHKIIFIMPPLYARYSFFFVFSSHHQDYLQYLDEWEVLNSLQGHRPSYWVCRQSQSCPGTSWTSYSGPILTIKSYSKLHSEKATSKKGKPTD